MSAGDKLKATVLACLTLLIALGGCSMIPYQKPEDRAQIQQDLNIPSEEILGITETNWCASPYGDIAVCKPVQGLGVLTTNGLILSLYEDKIYRRAFTLSAADIRCTHTLVSESTPELFYAFTDTQAFMLVPITPGGQMNILMKQKIYAYLNSEGAVRLTGNDVAFVEDTGRRQYGAKVFLVGAKFIPIPASAPVYRMVNPCPA